jgi:hemin uptake protein HemP
MKAMQDKMNANKTALSKNQLDVHGSKSASDIESESPGTKVLDSAQLFGQQQTLHIKHGEDVYCLRVTKLGKLILTK